MGSQELNLILSIVGAVAATAVFFVTAPAALILLVVVGAVCSAGNGVVSIVQYNRGEITAGECVFSVALAGVGLAGGLVGAAASNLMAARVGAGVMLGAAASMQCSLVGAAVAGAGLAP